MWTSMWWTVYDFCVLLTMYRIRLRERRKLSMIIWFVIMAYGSTVTSILLSLEDYEFYPNFGFLFLSFFFAFFNLFIYLFIY